MSFGGNYLIRSLEGWHPILAAALKQIQTNTVSHATMTDWNLEAVQKTSKVCYIDAQKQ